MLNNTLEELKHISKEIQEIDNHCSSFAVNSANDNPEQLLNVVIEIGKIIESLNKKFLIRKGIKKLNEK